MLEHYGNNRNNNELEKSVKNLQYRPRHLSLTIDYLLSETFWTKYSYRQNWVIGHSFGGYTALAGGKPWLQSGQQIKVHNDQE
jgi:predicted dienelactone hydrolase